MNNCTTTIFLSCARTQCERRIGGLLNSEWMTNECVFFFLRRTIIWYEYDEQTKKACTNYRTINAWILMLCREKKNRNFRNYYFITLNYANY